MTRGLSDYFIENQKYVLLHFDDGKSRRVSVKKLSGIVSEKDRQKILQSLSVYKGFTDKVLPPWLKVVAVGALSVGLISGTSRIAGTTLHANPKLERATPTVETAEAPLASTQPTDTALQQAVEKAKEYVAPFVGGEVTKTEFVESNRSDEGNVHANDNKSQRDKEKPKKD